MTTWREENEKSFGIYIRGNGSCKSTENHHTLVSLKPFGTSYTFTYWRSRKLRESHDKEVCAFFIANVLKLEPEWKASDRLMIKDDWKKHGFPVSNKLFSANAIFVKYLLHNIPNWCRDYYPLRYYRLRYDIQYVCTINNYESIYVACTCIIPMYYC